MLAFEPVVLEHKPDLALVMGDVNSTLACTLVCVKLGAHVAHAETGLRSFANNVYRAVDLSGLWLYANQPILDGWRMFSAEQNRAVEWDYRDVGQR